MLLLRGGRLTKMAACGCSDAEAASATDAAAGEGSQHPLILVNSFDFDQVLKGSRCQLPCSIGGVCSVLSQDFL